MSWGGKGSSWGDDSWGPYGGGGKGAMMMKAMFSMMMGKGKGKGFGKDGFGGGYDSGYGDMEDDGWGSSKKKKSNAAGYNTADFDSTVEGFVECMKNAFAEAGVDPASKDLEALSWEIQKKAVKAAKKFYVDERNGSKMSAAVCKAFLGEFVEAVMGSLTGYTDQEWFQKISWGPPILCLVNHTFKDGKIFTRTVKTDILTYIDEGILAWSEEERITHVMWAALEAGGMAEGQKKKASGHLAKGYDEAHWVAPFGESDDPSQPEINKLQEFTKGWMTHFVNKAHSQLENGFDDSSPAGIVAGLTAIFQALLNPENAAVPLPLQPHVQTRKSSMKASLLQRLGAYN